MKIKTRIVTFVAMMINGWGWAGPAGTNQTPERLQLDLDLVDGSRIIGVPTVTSVPIQTPYARMDIPLRQIVTIEIGEDHEQASIALRNGDSLRGVVNLGPVGLDTQFGNVNLGMEIVKRARVRLSNGTLSDAVRRGLLLHYPFDTDTGDKVADVSGNGRDGMVKGARWTREGRIAGAYKVGRGDGHIETPDQDVWSFPGKDFSVCLWLKLSSLPTGEQVLVGHDDGGGERNKWIFEFLNGNLDFHINNPRSQSYRIAAVPWRPETSRWYHLSVSRDKTTYILYVDGVAVSKEDNRLPLPAASAPLTIGQAEGLYVEGTIDELMIFDRALSAEEIQSVCDAGR